MPATSLLDDHLTALLQQVDPAHDILPPSGSVPSGSIYFNPKG
jgi:hypothetical protein